MSAPHVASGTDDSLDKVVVHYRIEIRVVDHLNDTRLGHNQEGSAIARTHIVNMSVHIVVAPPRGNFEVERKRIAVRAGRSLLGADAAHRAGASSIQRAPACLD